MNEDLFKTRNSSKKIKELYQELKKQILLIDETIEIIPEQKYITIKKSKPLANIFLNRSEIKVLLNLTKGQLEDPDSVARDVSNIGHWGNGDYEVSFSKAEELPVLLSLIKQSYEKNK